MRQYIDHTALQTDLTVDQIDKLLREAVEHQMKAVCIPPRFVSHAAKTLGKETPKVCTVIGFPLGYNTTATKVFETERAVRDGADEIDMVLAVGALKEGDDEYVLEDIRAVREVCQGKCLKVILETCRLTPEEIVRACRLCEKAGADFVKTSTGFGSGGATVEDVRLMADTVGNALGVKASGGIRDRAAAEKMLEAGATRIGTSNGVAILAEEAE